MSPNRLGSRHPIVQEGGNDDKLFTGTAFLRFSTAESAREAVGKHGQVLLERELNINFAKPRKPGQARTHHVPRPQPQPQKTATENSHGHRKQKTAVFGDPESIVGFAVGSAPCHTRV